MTHTDPNPYFNKPLQSPNGPGVGDSLIFSDGDIRVVVRHEVIKMTGQTSGVALTKIKEGTQSCLYHYTKAEVKIL